MKIQKTELAQKLSKVKSVVPKRSTQAALQGILVKDGYLIANNMEMAVKAKIGGAEGEPFIIPAKAFDLIKNLPDGMVEVRPERKGGSFGIVIMAEKIKNRYQTLDPSTFPVPNMEGGGGEFTAKAPALLASMRRVSYAIPDATANHTMGSLCLQASGGTLNFVGLDGHVLAWDKAGLDGEFELLIPKATVDQLLSIGLSGAVAIRHNQNGAIFATDEYKVHTRLVEGKYFKYASMFRELPLHTSVERARFLDAMVRAKMCTDEKSPARFSIQGDELGISIKDATADYHETVPLLEGIQQGLEIGFDARLVVETLKAFDCDSVDISLESPKMPMVIEDCKSDFKAIVLPVAIR